MTQLLPQPVIDAWLRGRSVHTVRSVGGGLSGAEICHVDAGSGRQWAIRRWPPAGNAQRVGEIHRVVRHAQRVGCQWLPVIESPDRPVAGDFCGPAAERSPVADPSPSYIVADGSIWDCCQWMPGRPPTPGDDAAVVLGEVAAAVGEFHAAVAPLAEQRGVVAAVTARLQRLAELDTLLRPLLVESGSWAHRDAWPPAVSAAVQTLRRAWSTARPRAAGLLDSWNHQRLRQQYVFRDIHVGNTLFVDGHLSGIVDFDAVRVDSPATDLARLILSVRLMLPTHRWDESSEGLWEVMIGAYRSRWPLSPEEERLAAVLTEVSPLVILGNWVLWVVCQHRSFPGPVARVHRRMEDWTRMVQHQFESDARSK